MQKKINKKIIFEKFKKWGYVAGVVTAVFMLALIISLTSATTTPVQQQTPVVEIGDNNHPPETEPTSTTTINFIMPLRSFEMIKDYSGSAVKFNNTLEQWETHKAVDLKSADGAEVFAVLSGTVKSIESKYLTGTVVVIDHGNNLHTSYGSLNKEVFVTVGERISQGHQIGTISTSAKNECADGAHLHFEVIQNDKKVDPNLFLVFDGK